MSDAGSDDIIVLENDPDSGSAPTDSRDGHQEGENLNRRAVLEDSSDDEAPLDDNGDSAAECDAPEAALAGGREILSSDGENEDDLNIKRRTRKGTEGLDSESTVCSICLDEYTNVGAHRLVCLKCGHLFGQSCIERWIRTSRQNAKCPQCKSRARLNDIRKLYVRSVKAVDTAEMEKLKERLSAYKNELDAMRLENEKLRDQLNASELLRAEALAAVDSVVNNSNSTKKQMLTLAEGPVVNLQPAPCAHTLDENGEHFVVVCRVSNPRILLSPFGLKLNAVEHWRIIVLCQLNLIGTSMSDRFPNLQISMSGRERMVLPVHRGRPRCCVFSPFDNRLLLSTGEDRLVCVTRYDEGYTVVYRYELSDNGWSCCWLGPSEFAVGLVTGRVLHFSLKTPSAIPLDVTHGSGRLPILYLTFSGSLLFVTSLRQLTVYQHNEPQILLNNKGSINYVGYDPIGSKVMVTFAPSFNQPTVTHVLYKLVDTDGRKELVHCKTYDMNNSKLTRIIKYAFWNIWNTSVAVIFDEASSQLMFLDWVSKHPAVLIKVDFPVVAIKELVTSDPMKYRIACLGEDRLQIFEASVLLV